MANVVDEMLLRYCEACSLAVKHFYRKVYLVLSIMVDCVTYCHMLHLKRSIIMLQR